MPKDRPEANSVLIVEDNRAIAAFLQTSINALEGIDAVVCATYAEVEATLKREAERFFIAVLDLNLPDAPDGEVVDYVQSHAIPVVVLTGTVDDDKREEMLKKEIADYVHKHHVMGINYVVNLVSRIFHARNHPILIVDDSGAYRAYLQQLLQMHGYSTISASNGEEGLEQLRAHPEVRLVVTDYHMPKMDGLEMCSKIRTFRSTDELAIIGVSDSKQAEVLPMFLKSGASDFLSKPFAVEEFFCRVDQNVDMIYYIEEARDAANRDFLTKLYNRRYFFEQAEKLYQQAQAGKCKIAVAMIDVDHFKSINDTYGHQLGDEALRAIAKALSGNLESNAVLARYGGEEFVCINPISADAPSGKCLERLRAAVESIELYDGDKKVSLTVSIGCTEELVENLDRMLSRADEALYAAKQSGRNRLIIS